MHGAMHYLLCTLFALASCKSHDGRVVTTDTSIEIFDRIEFVGTTATIAPCSLRTIAFMAEALVGNPQLRVIEVHASGADAGFGATVLGRARAQAVVAALVARGVAPARLRAVGTIERERGGRPTGPALVIAERGE